MRNYSRKIIYLLIKIFENKHLSLCRTSATILNVVDQESSATYSEFRYYLVLHSASSAISAQYLEQILQMDSILKGVRKR